MKLLGLLTTKHFFSFILGCPQDFNFAWPLWFGWVETGMNGRHILLTHLDGGKISQNFTKMIQIHRIFHEKFKPRGFNRDYCMYVCRIGTWYILDLLDYKDKLLLFFQLLNGLWPLGLQSTAPVVCMLSILHHDKAALSRHHDYSYVHMIGAHCCFLIKQ